MWKNEKGNKGSIDEGRKKNTRKGFRSVIWNLEQLHAPANSDICRHRQKQPPGGPPSQYILTPIMVVTRSPGLQITLIFKMLIPTLPLTILISVCMLEPSDLPSGL